MRKMKREVSSIVVRVSQKCSALHCEEQEKKYTRNKNLKRKQKAYEAGDGSARSVSPAFWYDGHAVSLWGSPQGYSYRRTP